MTFIHHARKLTLLIAVSFSFFILSFNCYAQSTGSTPTPSGHELSIHVGPLLPNSIAATDEIMHGFGFRYGYPILSKTLIEGGYTGSNTDGVSYSDVSVSLRGDIPFQDLFIYGLIGGNASRIKGSSTSDYTYYGGVHTGGGLLAHVADTLFLRMEMRFNFSPGTIMFFGFGFEYRFGSAGGN